ncbi:MAG: hypothetical protein Q9218_000430 [Villophora microphyllina]
MKKFAIRSKSENKVSQLSGSIDPLDDAESGFLDPPEYSSRRASESAVQALEEELYQDDHGLKLLSVGDKPCVAGIVFFATPHRGATSASLLKNVLRLTSLTTSIDKYVNDLKPGSALIDSINEAFSKNSGELELVSFYETQATPVIVSKESASMGLPKELRVAVAANHCNICWFQNQYESNYLLVSRTLGHVVRSITSKFKPDTPSASARKLSTNIPFPRNKDFLGHESILAAANDEIYKGRRNGYAPSICCHGFPGVGKTQVSIELAYRHAEEWSIFWVRAENKENLLQEFQKLAELVGINASPTTVVSAVKNWLRDEAGTEWMLIFDNADDVSIIPEFLPIGTNGAILISSRDPRLGDIVTRNIEVDVLTREEGIELLQRRAQVEPSDDVGKLVDLLGELPLAIEQAAAYIRERHVSVQQFIRLFENRKAKSRVLSRKVTATRYTNTDSVFGTISIALSKLEEECPLAAELIKVAAFYDAQDLSLDLLSGVLDVDSEHSSGLEDLDLLDALEGLEASALIIRRKSKSSVWVHVLVQAIVLEKLDTSKEYQRYLDKALAHMSVKFAEARRERTWQGLQPHVLKLMEHSEGYAFPSDTFDSIVNMFYTILWHLSFMGQNDSSVSLANKLSERLLKAYGPYDLRTIRFLRFIGIYYYLAANVLEAEAVLRRVLDKPGGYDLSDSQTSHEIACTKRVLAINSCRDGQPLEKRQLSKTVAQEALELTAAEGLETALTREALGHACRELGELEEAVKNMELSYEGVKASIGFYTTISVKALHNLGAHRRLLGGHHLDKAEEELKTALGAVDQAFGFLHFTKPKLHDSIAEIYYDRHDYTEAASNYREALALKHKIFPDPLHPEPGKTLMNLGIVYRALGEFHKAVEALQETVASRTAQFWREHPWTGEALRLLAMVYEDMGQQGDADAIWSDLRKWHGDRFKREGEIKLLSNMSINMSSEEYTLYSTDREQI